MMQQNVNDVVIDVRDDAGAKPAQQDVAPRIQPWLVRESVMGAKIVLMIADLVLLFALVAVLGQTLFGRPLAAGSVVDMNPVAVLAGVLAMPFLWSRLGLYRIRQRATAFRLIRKGFVGGAGMMLCLFTLMVVMDTAGVSRLFLALLGSGTAVLLTVNRLVVRSYLRHRFDRDAKQTHVLLVGDNLGAEQYLSTLEIHPELGVKAIGSVGLRPITGQPHLGDIHALERILRDKVVDEVVICLPFEEWPLIRECARTAELQGKTVRIPMLLTEEMESRSRIDQLGALPMFSLINTPDSLVMKGLKRALDLVGAGFGLLVTAPLLLTAAIGIKLTDGGPVFFSQVRVGRHGRQFNILKLRSMHVGAETRLDELQHLNERQGSAFKLSDDPRITPIGRFLRKTSLDEVPQFWNIIRGDMSLVGPRPALPNEVDTYDGRHRRRLSVKPGLTGLWQVSARQDASFERWVELDLDYIDTWSMQSDLRIMARTIPAVVRGTGT
ncbi:sugar transferase [Euzebya tangerina]|uniref:sugar transferase n=1 Tax=Euzebya tangerina TaxID=591198 RepID=UPI000E319A83|nr:sugar transferase [Euzebya tangerina]